MPAINITNQMYDLNNFSSDGNLLQFVQSSNDLTGGYFMMMVLLIGILILFVSFKSNKASNKDAFLASGFIGTVLTIFFATLNFISPKITTIIVILFGIVFAIFMVRE